MANNTQYKKRLKTIGKYPTYKIECSWLIPYKGHHGVDNNQTSSDIVNTLKGEPTFPKYRKTQCFPLQKNSSLMFLNTTKYIKFI